MILGLTTLSPPGGGAGGCLGRFFAVYVAYRIIVYSVTNYRPHLSHFNFQVPGTFANSKCEELSYPPKSENV